MDDPMADSRQPIATEMGIGEVQQRVQGRVKTSRKTFVNDHAAGFIPRHHLRFGKQILDFATHGRLKIFLGIEQGKFDTGGAGIHAEDRPLHAVAAARAIRTA